MGRCPRSGNANNNPRPAQPRRSRGRSHSAPRYPEGVPWAVTGSAVRQLADRRPCRRARGTHLPPGYPPRRQSRTVGPFCGSPVRPARSRRFLRAMPYRTAGCGLPCSPARLTCGATGDHFPPTRPWPLPFPPSPRRLERGPGGERPFSGARLLACPERSEGCGPRPVPAVPTAPTGVAHPAGKAERWGRRPFRLLDSSAVAVAATLESRLSTLGRMAVSTPRPLALAVAVTPESRISTLGRWPLYPIPYTPYPGPPLPPGD